MYEPEKLNSIESDGGGEYMLTLRWRKVRENLSVQGAVLGDYLEIRGGGVQTFEAESARIIRALLLYHDSRRFEVQANGSPWKR